MLVGKESGGGSGGKRGGAGGVSNEKAIIRAVSDYLGVKITPDVEILDPKVFDSQFGSPDDAIHGGIAAIRTEDGKIHIKKGFEGDLLHELVHDAGALEDNINEFTNEGITQLAAKRIGDVSDIKVRETYGRETKFVEEFILPVVGIPEKDFFRGYIKSKDKAGYIADLVWGKFEKELSDPEEWGTKFNNKENLKNSLRYAGPGLPQLTYLVEDLGLGKIVKMDYQRLLQATESILILRGGPTSGNWGHQGRPGKKGGSGRGGGFSKIGIKNGKQAGRGKIKQASRQTRSKEERAGGGGVKATSGAIPADVVDRAKGEISKAKTQRDRDLKKVLSVEIEIQKASIANQKASVEFSKADARALKSLEASNKHLEKINKVAEKEIEAGRLSPWARRETSETLRPLLEKQKQLDARDKVNYEKVNEANRKLVKTSEDLNKAINKRNSLPDGLKFTDEVMSAYQKETERASKVLFQHHLNEAKRVRGDLQAAEAKRMSEIKQLAIQKAKYEKQLDDHHNRMQKANFPDNDPRAMAMIDESFEISKKYGEAARRLNSLTKDQRDIYRDMLKVDSPTRITKAPGSELDRSKIRKDNWKTGINGFQDLVSDNVVPKGTPVRFVNTDRSRSFHTGGTSKSQISMAEFSGPGVVAHELGHMAETENSRLLKRSIEWRDRRTRGEDWQKLSTITKNDGYNDRERAKPDKFVSPYIGKDYGDRASEVFSMGIEEMYRDPVGFARKDPDMFDFIYAQARTP